MLDFCVQQSVNREINNHDNATKTAHHNERGPIMHTTSPHTILYTHANSTAELDAQHAAVTAYCQAHGLDPVTEFHDVGDRRHGLDMLLHAATDPAVSYVITPHWPPDHLTSSEALSTQEILAHYGVWLVSFTTQDETDEETT